MNLLHYLPCLLAFMVITAVVYAWGLYRAQTADRDDQALLESKGASRIRRALRKKGPMTRAQLRPVVESLPPAAPFPSGALPSQTRTSSWMRCCPTW